MGNSSFWYNCLLTKPLCHLFIPFTTKSIHIVYKDSSRTSKRTVHAVAQLVNPLTPNDPYRGRTAPLTSKRCILYIYSTNISTEYFKHGIYSPFFISSKCSFFFMILTYSVPVLFTFYIQCVLKLKKSGVTTPIGVVPHR